MEYWTMKVTFFLLVNEIIQYEDEDLFQFETVLFILQYKAISVQQIMWLNGILLLWNTGWITAWCLLCQLDQSQQSV